MPMVARDSPPATSELLVLHVVASLSYFDRFIPSHQLSLSFVVIIILVSFQLVQYTIFRRQTFPPFGFATSLDKQWAIASDFYTAIGLHRKMAGQQLLFLLLIDDDKRDRRPSLHIGVYWSTLGHRGLRSSY